jgi:hypothetical protein
VGNWIYSTISKNLFDRALVHQLIRGLNQKFSFLKTLLPLLPRFPTFIEARDLVLSDETTLLVVGAAACKTKAHTPTQPPADHPTNNANYNNIGGRGCGHGCGGGRGHDDRNIGRGGGRKQQQRWPCSSMAPFCSMGFSLGSCMACSMDWYHRSWSSQFLATLDACVGLLGFPANDNVNASPSSLLGHIWPCASTAGCLSLVGLQSEGLVYGYCCLITYDR